MGLGERILDRLGVPRRVAAQVPLGTALRDHFQSGISRPILVRRREEFEYSIESRDFFRLDGRLESLDECALELSRGRVLDVGAGAGRHSLILQERGVDVTAVDLSPLCVEIMRGRGVRDARILDVFHLEEISSERFDTILFLMQSIGIAGSVFGLERLLHSLDPLLARGGQILLDSSALPGMEGATAGETRGVEVSFRYRGLRGEVFSWLYIGENALAEATHRVGWNCEIVTQLATGEYLARLTAPSDRPRGVE